jgi:hypothetical protein
VLPPRAKGVNAQQKRAGGQETTFLIEFKPFPVV